MGFFTKLFGLARESKSVEVEPVEYSGYQIYAEPVAKGGQYQVNGRICRVVDGELKIHHFIRSDMMATEEDAIDIMVCKSKLFIDQVGDDIFLGSES